MQSQTTDEILAHHDRLVHRFASRLQSRFGARVRDFRMSVHENGLILQGRVCTYYGKQAAQHVAMEVSGLAILANDIEVQ